MKLLKRILIVIVIIIAIPLMLALFTKKEYTIVREVTINKPKAEVFAYLKLLKNQDNFSKWMKIDPAAKKTYTGTDGTIGFMAAWESTNDKLGQGTQTISKIAEGDRIDYDLHFIKPYTAAAAAYLATADAAGQTKVTWGFNGKMPYPFNVMLLLGNMDKMIGDDLQTGLVNLKALLEK